jgi:hypothetical protein
VNAANRVFRLTPQQSLAIAMGDLLDRKVDALQLQKIGTQGPYETFQFASQSSAMAAGVAVAFVLARERKYKNVRKHRQQTGVRHAIADGRCAGVLLQPHIGRE